MEKKNKSLKSLKVLFPYLNLQLYYILGTKKSESLKSLKSLTSRLVFLPFFLVVVVPSNLNPFLVTKQTCFLNRFLGYIGTLRLKKHISHQNPQPPRLAAQFFQKPQLLQISNWQHCTTAFAGCSLFRLVPFQAWQPLQAYQDAAVTAAAPSPPPPPPRAPPSWPSPGSSGG